MRAAILICVILAGCLQRNPPPAPVAPPSPGQVVSTGVRVLVLYETADQSVEVMRSKSVREWLKSHGVEVRLWDDDVDASNVDPFWRDAVKLPRDSLPWMWVSNGNGGGVNGPLPTTEAEVLKMLERGAM